MAEAGFALRWRQAALADLEDIFEFVAQDNPNAAVKLASSIRNQAERLRLNPHLGRPGRIAGIRELVVPRVPYIVAYQVRGRRIEILAVVHTSRLWPTGF
jgi:addiction module RelE/StbE family toxin